MFNNGDIVTFTKPMMIIHERWIPNKTWKNGYISGYRTARSNDVYVILSNQQETIIFNTNSTTFPLWKLENTQLKLVQSSNLNSQEIISQYKISHYNLFENLTF